MLSHRLLGLALAGISVAMLVWLVDDVVESPPGPFALVSRIAVVVFWAALAAVMISERRGVPAVVTAGVAFAVMVVSSAVGLVVTPGDFVGVTSRGPTTPEAARVLGVVVLIALAGGGAWLWRRRAGFRDGR